METWCTCPPPIDTAAAIATRQGVLEVRGRPVGRMRRLERPASIDRDRCIEAVADTGEGARSRGKLIADTWSLPRAGIASLPWFVPGITWLKWAHFRPPPCSEFQP